MQICSFHEMPIFAAIAWLAGTSAFWISCILLGQLHLIAGETTTFEVTLAPTLTLPTSPLTNSLSLLFFPRSG